MLFSEPKIPQRSAPKPSPSPLRPVSVLFSEPKIPQLAHQLLERDRRCVVSVLFSEPKIPQHNIRPVPERHADPVSVLFSEPKIPQPHTEAATLACSPCFSALQRAENSSTGTRSRPSRRRLSFSALQRAENSSTQNAKPTTSSVTVSVLFSEPKIPQPGPRGACSGR